MLCGILIAVIYLISEAPSIWLCRIFFSFGSCVDNDFSILWSTMEVILHRCGTSYTRKLNTYLCSFTFYLFNWDVELCVTALYPI